MRIYNPLQLIRNLREFGRFFFSKSALANNGNRLIVMAAGRKGGGEGVIGQIVVVP